MEKIENQVEIACRIAEIRAKMYDGVNRKMARAIGENENILGAICSGHRAPGLTTILKIVNANPDVDANWLLTGRIPRPTTKLYEKNEERAVLMASEPKVPYGSKTDTVSWERYDAAQQEIGSLRTRLEQSAESVARLLKENSDLRKNPASPSAATPEAPIFV